MSSCRWLSCLLLFCVCLSALFSVSSIAYGANNNSNNHNDSASSVPQVSSYSLEDVASTIDNINYRVYVVNSSDLSYVSLLLDKNIQAGTWGIQDALNIAPYRWSEYNIEEAFIYTKGTNNLIASKGSSIHFNLSGIYNRLVATYNGSDYEATSLPYINKIQITLDDKNGSTFYSNFLSKDTFSTTSIGGYKYDLIDFTVDNIDSDLYKIGIYVYFNPRSNFPLDDTVFNYASSYRLLTGLGDKTMLQVFVDDGTKSLISGIKDIVSNIKDGISNLITGITELPSKLWNLIENGLKGLFVPSETEMTEIKNQWDTLLSDRFGGLYQTVQLIDDYADSFKDPVQQNSIKIPELKIPFGQSEFVFGGQDVQIVPDKFSFLIDVIKTIISIIATCLFVNGLRNRFERLVGGQE